MTDSVREARKAPAAAGGFGPLDPRRDVFRRDLASKALYGRVSAPRYVQGTPAQIARAAVPLRGRPDAADGFVTEALFGERVDVFEERDGWAWVQLARDRYVGYVPVDTLSAEISEPTHWVRSLGTFVYPVADIKSSPLMHLSICAEVSVSSADERFSQLASGGFVVSRHLAERTRPARDFVEVAERFIGTPYLWGGRTRVGIDCSGLVQVSLEAAGIAAPRDTDMQQAEVGEVVAVTELLENLQRGDLVFWKGHVGIMSDGVTLLHGNAHHMMVTVETLPEAVYRIGKTGGDILAVKRLPALSARA